MIFKSKEEENLYYKEFEFICPKCKEKTDGIGHVYNNIRICDDCYCDIIDMQKVNKQIVYGNEKHRFYWRSDYE